ncbi:MAG: hypothetical protein K2I10_03085, partial [Lachnospiraceae bacterium]|nr:hypothetical protein [Lachnospiraceae bacterium]
VTKGGENTLKIYYNYTPDKADYKVEYYLQDKDDPTVYNKQDKDTVTKTGVIVGTPVSDTEHPKTYTDYTYTTVAGKSIPDITVTKGGENTLKIYYNYTPDKADYKVEYYLQDKDNPEVYNKQDADTETRTGVIVGTKVYDTEHPKTYTDYTYTTVAGKSIPDITVSKDGENTLKIYYNYTPDKADYKVEYYLQDKDNPEVYNKQDADTVTKTGVIIGTEVSDTEYSKTYQSYEYTTVTGKSIADITVTKGGENTLKLYYNLIKTTYKTEYYLKQPDGTYRLEDTIPGNEVIPGTTVNATEIPYPGYTHVQNDLSHETDVVQPDGSTVLKVYYDPVKPQYKVEYYVEQPDGSYKLYTETTGLTGETGQSVKAEIITINGYSHIQTTQSKESGTIAADGSTVLKVYYKLNDTPIIQPPVTTESPTTTEEEEEEEDDDDEDEDEPESKSTKSAKTGDETDLGFLFVIMLSAVTGSAVCLYIRKKEDE